MIEKSILKTLAQVGIVPVIRTSSPELAVRAVNAVTTGGIPVAEITMTIPDAISVIKTLKKKYNSQVTIGAGTVMNVSQCKNALQAGACFVVTPTMNLDVVKYCKKSQICVIGGAMTPTEIFTVYHSGADAVKVFPAKTVGGPDFIKLVHDPLPHIPLVPTGGVHLQNIVQYLKSGALFVCAGTDLINQSALSANLIDEIVQRSQAYVNAVKSFKELNDNNELSQKKPS